MARIGAQVADALAYAHAQGVLHRDIKPSNLLLDAAGQGLGRRLRPGQAVEGSDGPTAAGDVVGTLRYMAPERFEGLSDRRSDIYGLGATLYELLALRPAFDEPDQAAAHRPDRPRAADAVATARPPHPPRPGGDRPEVPGQGPEGPLPDRRGAAGRAASGSSQNRPTRTRPLSPPEQLWRWCKRNPLVAGLNALAAALTIVIAVVSTVAAYRNGRLAAQLEGQHDEANQNLVQANKNLIQAYTTEAEARRQSRRVGQRFEALGAIERAMGLAPNVGITEAERFRLRNEAIAALALPDLRVAKELDVPRAMRERLRGRSGLRAVRLQARRRHGDRPPPGR